MRKPLWQPARSGPAALLILAFTLILLPPPSSAFLMGNHRRVTERAILRLPAAAALPQWERAKLIAGVVDADLVDGGIPLTAASYDAVFHFDELGSYAAVQQNYEKIIRLVRENLGKQQKDPWEFGKILHAIEDFYSHSNYIPLYRAYRESRNQPVGSIPPFEAVLLQPDLYPGFREALMRSLRTGNYKSQALLPGDQDHGYLVGPGMHKDTLPRRFHFEAREAAEMATVWYLRLYVGDANARSECQAIWGIAL